MRSSVRPFLKWAGATRRTLSELVERGCHVVISNSTAPIVEELYRKRSMRPLRAHKVPAKRAINPDSRGRGVVMEYIISNVRPSEGRAGERR